MKHRLYLPPPLSTGAEITLDAERAHYLVRVLRLTRDTRLICFDGEGSAWASTLTTASPKAATLRLDELLEQRPPPVAALHLAQGLLKGAAMDQVIQKATELGVTDLWLVAAARSNVSLDRSRMERKLEHWRKIIQNAAEQCHQLHLPRLHGPLPLTDCLVALSETHLIMLDPGAPALPLQVDGDAIAILIGPEGGWSEPERDLAAGHGVHRHGLGPLILRAETAPLAVLAAIRHGRGWA